MTDALRVLAALQFAYPDGLTSGQIAWRLSWPLYRAEAALEELASNGLIEREVERDWYVYRPKRGDRR